ncbi:MAG: hypothetical protein ACP5OA_06560, partial [Candidatus Woesearchaeota archaeon]
IFILIAGFVIFLFIISIVLSQKRQADIKIDITAINQITTLLKSKQQTANVYSEILLPTTEMNFRCDLDERYFSYKISNSERITLPTEIIFTSQEIDSQKIRVWSQPFDVGFPVSVFMYILPYESVIVIYNQTSGPVTTCSYAKQLYDSLPNNISKNISSTPASLAAYRSNRNAKILCFSGPGCACPPLGLYDYVRISPAVGLFSYGNVTFQKKGGSSVTKPYLSSAGLYGAIFSDNSEFYECQMSRALDQFEVKRLLVEKRLEMMERVLDAGGPSSCGDKIISALDEEIIPLSNPSFTYRNITNIYRLSNRLDSRNTDLTLSSCPKIY